MPGVPQPARAKQRPRRAVLLPALLLAGLPAGCGRPAPEGARLTVVVVGAPWPGGLAARMEAETTRPTLIARDGAGQIVPGLASSWRFVDDGRGLILRLRPRQWSDGSRLGANEVVTAFRRAADPSAPGATRPGTVAGSGAAPEPALFHAGVVGAPPLAPGEPHKLGVLAPISRVVELRLVAPSPLLLGWLAEPGLAIVRSGTPAKPPATLAAYVGSGPPERRVLTRRDPVVTPEARPAEIVVASTADATAAFARFGRGDCDIVVGDGLAGLGEARTVGRADTLRIDSLWGVYGYVANGRTGPLADARVRLALTLGIDRAALVQRYGIAAMVPVEGLLPPALGVAQPAQGGAASPQGLDAASRAMLAGQLLKSAGHDPATPLRLVLLLPPGRDHVRLAEAVAADWRRLGVELILSERPAAAIATAVARGAFDLALTEASVPVPDAGALLSRWRCGTGPSCNPAADALLDAARRAAPANRPALLAQAEARLLEGPPMVPLFTPVRWALVARRVDGWLANPAGSHPLARLAVNP